MVELRLTTHNTRRPDLLRLRPAVVARHLHEHMEMFFVLYRVGGGSFSVVVTVCGMQQGGLAREVS